MQVLLNLSAIDFYTNRLNSNELQLESRILPSEMLPDIQFYPDNQVETRLCLIYKCMIEQSLQNSETRRVLKNCPVETQRYHYDKQYKLIFACFLVAKGKKLTYFFFRILPKLITVTSDEVNSTNQPLLLVARKVVKQVKLIVDHHLFSRCLSQRMKSIAMPIPGSVRSKLVDWLNLNFKRYYKVTDLRSFINQPLAYFKKDLQVNDGVLNSDIITAALKKMMRKAWKNELKDSCIGTRLIKKFLKDDRTEGMLDSHSHSSIIIGLKDFLRWMTAHIIDNLQTYYDGEECDSIVMDIVGCIEVMRMLISLAYLPINLITSNGPHLLNESPALFNDRVPYSLLSEIYDRLLLGTTTKVEVLEEFTDDDHYKRYLQTIHYSVMRILGYKNSPLKSKEREILAFLTDSKNLNELNITERNTQDVLTTIKIVDIALRNSHVVCSRTSYQLRQRVLQMSAYEMTTCEVYTNSLNSQNYTDFHYLINPKSWVNERVAMQAKLTMDHNILSRFLSQRMQPIVIATRGNTGVGKSFWVHHFVKEFLEENAQLSQGVLNPDIIKAGLKMIMDKDLLNSQVYTEGRIIFEKLLETLTMHVNKMMSTVIDTRLLTIEEFRQVLAIANLRGVNLELLDVDAPIWNSIISVLNREPFGKDPCVPFEVIKDGFIRARKYRATFIRASCKEKVNYSLYRVAKDGQFKLIAENRNNQFKQYSEKLEKYLKTPSNEELDEIGSTQITEKWINSLLSHKKQAVERWKGYTVQDALLKHSQGEKPIAEQINS